MQGLILCLLRCLPLHFELQLGLDFGLVSGRLHCVPLHCQMLRGLDLVLETDLATCLGKEEEAAETNTAEVQHWREQMRLQQEEPVGAGSREGGLLARPLPCQGSSLAIETAAVFEKCVAAQRLGLETAEGL